MPSKAKCSIFRTENFDFPANRGGDITDHSPDKPGVLPKQLKRRQHALVDEAEIGAARRDVHRRQGVQQAVIPLGRLPLEKAYALRVLAYRLHDVVAFPPILNQLGNHFRRVLQVAVHHDDSVASGVVHAAGNGQLMTKITGQQKRTHVLVLLRQPAEQQRRRIPGSVVDKYNFIFHVQILNCLCRFCIKLLNV